jgi:5'-phosphate synthase pdxT subunit
MPEDFEGLEGLVIPGGESTTLLKLLGDECKKRIEELARKGGVLFGTCAGALLLARRVVNPTQDCLGLLDVEMVRNGYGRQVQSFTVRLGDAEVEGEAVPKEMVFIRAPIFKEVGPRVHVLARVRGAPVYVEEGNILASTFHPELTTDPSVHQHFLSKVEQAGGR